MWSRVFFNIFFIYHITSLHCDLDLEDSNPISLRDTWAPDIDTPSHQVRLKNNQQARELISAENMKHKHSNKDLRRLG